MAQFAVIGLGSFGATVATQLIELGHDVIGIDSEKKYVENISEQVTHAVIADATDEHVLDELNIEASILCVLHLKNIGVEKIWVKAKSKSHHMILSHLGISKIIHPEEDMGVRIAQSLCYPMVSRYMALEDNHYIVKIEIDEKLQGTRFHQLMDQAPDVKTLLHKRGKDVLYSIDPNLILQVGDILVVEGLVETLRRLSARFKP